MTIQIEDDLNVLSQPNLNLISQAAKSNSHNFFNEKKKLNNKKTTKTNITLLNNICFGVNINVVGLNFETNLPSSCLTNREFNNHGQTLAINNVFA